MSNKTRQRSLTAVLAASILAMPVAGQAESQTLGFVVKDWMTAVYETKFIDECPGGLAIPNEEIWWRDLSKAERSELTQDGLLSSLARWFTAVRRGPNGEDVCINPTVVQDPPMPVVEGKVSFGKNLDGNVDGSATPKTCAHENFVSPTGEPGIDNQMYRLVGCIYGWREAGVVEVNANEMRRTSGLAMILIEVEGVDDPRNDDEVTVSFYRSIDQFPLDSSGQVIPFSSYRIDTADGKARYGDSLKGSIKDGVLETESGDVRLALLWQLQLHASGDSRYVDSPGDRRGRRDCRRLCLRLLRSGAVHVSDRRTGSGDPDVLLQLPRLQRGCPPAGGRLPGPGDRGVHPSLLRVRNRCPCGFHYSPGRK